MENEEKKTNMEEQYRRKFIITGPDTANVGGFLHYLHKSKQDFSKTLGVNIFTEKIYYKSSVFQINIWHLANSPDEDAKNARALFTQGANGAIIIFNGSDPNGLEKITPFTQEISKILEPHTCKVLLGNMVEGNKIGYEKCHEFAKSNNMLYVERYNYDFEVILLALSLLSVQMSVPPVYKNIFGDSYGQFMKAQGGQKYQPSPESAEEKKFSAKEHEQNWKKEWESMWKKIKSEEQIIVEQRLAQLQANLNEIVSEFYTSKSITSPVLEFFDLPKPEKSQFPRLVLKWLGTSPQKIEALRKFLENEEQIQEKYWKEFYSLRLELLERRMEIFEKFDQQIQKIIKSQKETQEEINKIRESEGLPNRISIGIAEFKKILEDVLKEESHKLR